jgi:hypothetical protein
VLADDQITFPSCQHFMTVYEVKSVHHLEPSLHESYSWEGFYLVVRAAVVGLEEVDSREEHCDMRVLFKTSRVSPTPLRIPYRAASQVVEEVSCLAQSNRHLTASRPVTKLRVMSGSHSHTDRSSICLLLQLFASHCVLT